MSVLGVDLRASNKKPSPVAVLDPDFQLTQLVSFYEDIELAALGEVGYRVWGGGLTRHGVRTTVSPSTEVQRILEIDLCVLVWM